MSATFDTLIANQQISCIHSINARGDPRRRALSLSRARASTPPGRGPWTDALRLYRDTRRVAVMPRAVTVRTESETGCARRTRATSDWTILRIYNLGTYTAVRPAPEWALHVFRPEYCSGNITLLHRKNV